MNKATQKKATWGVGIAAAVVMGGMVFAGQPQALEQLAAAGGGADQFGYNEKARIFQGAADGVDRILDNKVWGDPTYAKDTLVMKWNRQWDACNDAGNNSEAACAGAWINNEWNGAKAGGSGEVWHYKIIWVGAAGELSSHWQPGGYLVWGNYEVLMDQGMSKNDGPAHVWFAKSTPNGYGASK